MLHARIDIMCVLYAAVSCIVANANMFCFPQAVMKPQTEELMRKLSLMSAIFGNKQKRKQRSRLLLPQQLAIIATDMIVQYATSVCCLLGKLNWSM